MSELTLKDWITMYVGVGTFTLTSAGILWKMISSNINMESEKTKAWTEILIGKETETITKSVNDTAAHIHERINHQTGIWSEQKEKSAVEIGVLKYVSTATEKRLDHIEAGISSLNRKIDELAALQNKSFVEIMRRNEEERR